MSVKPSDSAFKKNNSTFYQEKTKDTKKTLEKQEKKIDVRFGRVNFVHMKDKNIFSEYDMIEKLGEGAYGCVYKVQQKNTEFIRAVKAIKRKHVDGEAFGNEIEILRTVDHPNIIKLFDCFYDNEYFYMVEEFCSGGDLYEYIREVRFFSEKKAAQVLFQLLSAINYLHKKNIVHRDLKPENIVFIKTRQNAGLVDKNEEIFIKLIDFGTSVHLTEGKLTQELGTIYYIAPEVFKNDYNERADIWSIGIILYILLCGHPPFLGRKEEDIKEKIINSPVMFLSRDFSRVSNEAIEFVKELLTYDYEQRPSAEMALQNRWLNEKRVSESEENILQADVLENLSKFSSTITLQKATLSFLANQISINDEIKKLKDEFDKIDKDKDGEITLPELTQCFLSLYSKPEAERKAKAIFQEIDFNNDGSINFSEFITARMQKEQLVNEEMLRKAFKMFDLDGNGYLTVDELMETMPLEIHDSSQWLEIVKEVDKDGDQRISFEEFKEMMQKLANRK